MITKEEIIEGNLSIVKFLGYKLITPEMRNNPEQWKYSYWEGKDSEGFKRVLRGDPEQMPFHYAWGELMRVVETIENTKDEQGYGYMIKIWNTGCCILENNAGFTVIENTFGLTKKEAVWKAVVKFIEWYNESKK